MLFAIYVAIVYYTHTHNEKLMQYTLYVEVSVMSYGYHMYC